MLQQLFRVNPFVLGVCVGEMITDVPEGQCSKQRITNNMQQYIRVAVPNSPVGVGNLDTTEPEGLPFRQLVDIVTVTDSKRHWPLVFDFRSLRQIRELQTQREAQRVCQRILLTC